VYPLALRGATSSYQQSSDLLKRQSYVLRLFNKPYAFNCVLSKETESAARSAGGFQQALTLIVADRINAHASIGGNFTYLQLRLNHSASLHPGASSRVKQKVT